VTPERRARWLLALGAATGLAIAIGSLVGGTIDRPLGADAVALVNDTPIRRDDYLRALGAVATDRRTPLDDADKRRILDRLIDEELLLQRGLALGLPERDHSVRAPLVAATIDLLARANREPTDAELRAFYDANREYFTDPGRVRVGQVFVRVEGRSETDARTRADDALRRLRAAEPLATVRAALGDDETAPIPDTLLPIEKVREYVGQTAARAVADLDVGATSDVVRSSMGFHVLQVRERTDPEVPPYDAIVDRVRAEWRRRADDVALRSALDDLRRGAKVRITEALP
jgi:parvulin-like peptidyl-prolyl cis-trans isomerase-like protein